MKMQVKASARNRFGLSALGVCFWGAIVLVAGALVAAPPPQGRTYFTVNLGVDGPFETAADCWRFTATDVCMSSDLCGSWERTEPAGPETGFAFEFSYEEQGVRVEIEGEGRIDNRGPQDSGAIAARARAGGKSINFAIAGRSTSPGNCSRLMREWTRKSPPDQVRQTPVCIEYAKFGSPVDSPYILPFSVAEEPRLSGTYCADDGGHRMLLAYDFVLPVGAEVIAARAGRVRHVQDGFPDDGSSDPNAEPNEVWVEHDDGTAALYNHLRQHSVVVAEGQDVAQGQLLGRSGNSGFSGGLPHLHFQVFERMLFISDGWPPPLTIQVPVSFRNALGPLDRRAGLIQEVYYKALLER